MSGQINKNKDSSLSNVDNSSATSVAEAINSAFDNVELSTVGKLCLDARLNKGLTQEQASALLKVRVKIIKDFENGDEIDLPGLAYKIGFVRSYASLLGLDGNLLVADFKESLEVNNFKEDYKFLSPKIEGRKILPTGAVFSFVIAVLFYTAWYYSDRKDDVQIASNVIIEADESKESELAKNYVIIEENFQSNNIASLKTNNKDNALPVSSFKEKVSDIKNNTQVSDNKKILNNGSLLKENNFKRDQNFVDKRKDKIQISKIDNEISEMSAEANERDPSTEMVLKATGNSWVEIEDVDGNILMTRLMRPGETYVVPNINGLTFNTGNAGALSLTQGNILIPSLGEVGEIIKARPLNIKVFGNKTILD